jgi:ankyrin repeat protein
MADLDEATRALHRAVEDGEVEAAKEAIARGAALNVPKEDGYHVLAFVSDVRLVELLLNAGADPTEPAECGTPLDWAASANRLEVVRMLCDAGAVARMEYEPEDSDSALHQAAGHGNVEMVRVLLKAGGHSLLNCFDYISRTPLMCAVDAGDIESVRVLIDAGSDVNVVDEEGIGDPAINGAVREASVEIVQALLDAGADPSTPGWMQRTAYHELDERAPGEVEQVRAMLDEAARRLEEG